ncbi:hypothetical protein PHMEG_00019537 [Phytophthora megakarya]|uniref:Uncharacterized protein n=1 Tax=Phytophthora megakarya TaxID=4795 RepID=A0A225VR31_9STRA|nr:hypothetical protein PHMEG_00019537 [Phytophthora megakarya]
MSMRLPCRHAIAFRKSNKVAGPLIPWNSIDERWTTSVGELKKVQQFSYERFKDPPCLVSAKNAEQPHKDTKKLCGLHIWWLLN